MTRSMCFEVHGWNEIVTESTHAQCELCKIRNDCQDAWVPTTREIIDSSSRCSLFESVSQGAVVVALSKWPWQMLIKEKNRLDVAERSPVATTPVIQRSLFIKLSPTVNPLDTVSVSEFPERPSVQVHVLLIVPDFVLISWMCWQGSKDRH